MAYYKNQETPYLPDDIIILQRTNSKLINAVLKAPKARCWQQADYSECDVYTFNVKKKSSEFKDIAAKFYSTSNGHTLTKVIRVQNPFMLGQFLLKREEMGVDTVNTLKYFHGTKKEYIDNIIEENFNWRFHGTSKGTRFGKGVNFTPSAGFATNFGDKSIKRVMILAYVLVGNTCIGYDGMDLPIDATDTATKSDGKVVVKFDDDEFYPAYILHYTSKKK